MKIDYGKHYNDDYWQGEKTYTAADGTTQKYHGPSLRWEGFEEIARIVRTSLGKTRATMGPTLDVGCGGGDLVRRISSAAYGVEISEHAIRNCVDEMDGRIALADITTTPRELIAKSNTKKWDLHLPKTFDNLISTDLMEHIYEEDLKKTFRWMKSRTQRFMFLLVATMPENQREFVLQKGEEVPPEFEVTAVSGHVNVRHWKYWAKFFRSEGCRIRFDLMWNFHRMARSVPWLAEMEAWGHDNVWILEE